MQKFGRWWSVCLGIAVVAGMMVLLAIAAGVLALVIRVIFR